MATLSNAEARLTAVTLAILAGGRGERMGRPKASLTIGRTPILVHLLDRFAWPGPTLLVTAPGRQRPTGHDRFDAEAVDPVADQGPLRGVLTAVEHAPTRLVLVTTVDMPGILRSHLCWMVDGMPPDAAALMIEHGGRREPFPLLLRTTLAGAIRNRIEDGRRSVHGLSGESAVAIRVPPIDWPATTWANLNTPAEYAAFESG